MTAVGMEGFSDVRYEGADEGNHVIAPKRSPNRYRRLHCKFNNRGKNLKIIQVVIPLLGEVLGNF